MAVAKLSSQCRKRVKYKVRTAARRTTKQQVTNPSKAWVMLSTGRQGMYLSCHSRRTSRRTHWWRWRKCSKGSQSRAPEGKRQRKIRPVHPKLTLFTATHTFSKLSMDSVGVDRYSGSGSCPGFCGVTVVYLNQESVPTFLSWSPEDLHTSHLPFARDL